MNQYGESSTSGFTPRPASSSTRQDGGDPRRRSLRPFGAIQAYAETYADLGIRISTPTPTCVTRYECFMVARFDLPQRHDQVRPLGRLVQAAYAISARASGG